MEFVELTDKEFEEFSKKNEKANFFQTIEYKNLKESDNIKVDLVGVKEKNKVLCASLLVEEKYKSHVTFYAPRGFLIDFHNKELLTFFVNNLKDYVKKRKGFRIVIDPNLIYRTRNADGSIIDENEKDDESFNNIKSLGFKHFGFNIYFETRQVRYGFKMILDEDYEEKKKNFSKSTRKNIETAQNNGLTIRIGADKDLAIMEELFEATATRKDFFFRKLDYYKKMYEYMHDLMTIYFAHVDPDIYLNYSKNNLDMEIENNKSIEEKMKKDMVGAKLKNQKETSDNRIVKLKEELEKATKFKEENPDGKDIACLLSMWNGEEYLTLTSGGLEEYRYFTPKYAMYDAHIKDAYKKKYKACNFYGISGNFEKENNPVYGVYEFKRGFNGNVIEYIGQFELKTSWFYNIYSALRKVKNIIKR